MTNELFDKVVAITEDYLGPAAPRFVTRQISFHLGKTPEELSAADIPQLVEWTKATLALLTNDKDMVQDFAVKVLELGR
ncbi:MAG: hypothetical protein NVSMB39_3250 [Candidatus Saccharimonadales bacterium]